ncbi:MAG: glutamine-hydrolyzing carbamoyl-phosphate synthase small subunit [Candidatus Orphnella occulta]|nr:glutamine-hydrolyzing carbamoyl-phosphate synthase small subunit [Candidatus Orphnella occulta]
MKTKLVLEDGSVFNGYSFGAAGERSAEIVFNTSMTGYQEIITDPSYAGQMVTMTYPLIGNYGVNEDDKESKKPFLDALVVKELSCIASNWRSEMSLSEYMKKHHVLGIQGIDTRALARHIRTKGSMRAVISTDDLDDASLVQKASSCASLLGRNLVKDVTCDKTYNWNEDGKFKVAVIDCGVKYNILRNLKANDCSVTVFPCHTSAQDILSIKPDGIFISNGPGDPSAVLDVIETTKALIGKLPIFGICLGQQIIGLALGGKTFKLKFGHHGGNHPVKDVLSGKCYITSQNHGFCIDIDSLPKRDIDITHINLNDKTLEGIAHKKEPLFSVQFHPEAGPGPHDAQGLFGSFTKMMEEFHA